MKMFAMRPVVVLSFLALCAAVEMETEMEMDDELVGGTGERSEKKEAFTQKECLNVVKKVTQSGRYTEESIVPVCIDVMGRSSNCDFFAEALSLASSHSDFQGKHFCGDMDRAQFCSEIMDKLLESTAVSDLAFGECERAKPQKSIEYCRRIQQMLGLSVKQEDLDTIRACYMMEAYTNQTASTSNKALEANEVAPQSRIITGSNKELDNVGKGGGAGHPPKESNIGRGDIVLQPVPLENFGKGKGNMTKPKNIIVEPEKAGAAPAAAAPAAAAPAAAEKGPILAKPIPAPVKSELQTSVSKVTATAKAAPAKATAPVVVEAARPMFFAQPMVAQAIMQNGTLVMTGAPFGSVVVDQKGIEEALQKQAANSKQAVAIKQAVVPKPVAAAPKQAVAPKVAAAQPAKAKAGLLVTEPARVVAAPAQKAAAPVAQIAQPAAATAQKPQQPVPVIVVVEQMAAPTKATVAAPKAPAKTVAATPVAQAPAKAVAATPVAQAPANTVAATPAAQAPVKTVAAAPVKTVAAAPVKTVAQAAPKPAATASAKVVSDTAKATPGKSITQTTPTKATVSKAAPANKKDKDAAPHVVSKHSTGLAQKGLKHGKVDLKEKKEKKVQKKSQYAGFLSSFVNI